MKIFRHERGHEAGRTMTVAELKEKLSQYPDDMPVMALWEEVYAYIEPQNFDVEKVSKGNKEDECDCVTIWVEKY